MNMISLVITSLLTGNIVLTKFLGICPFIGVSKNEKSAFGMGIAVTLVVTLSSILTYFIYYDLLVPTHCEYLKTIMFILVIASMVQLLILVIKKYFPKLHNSLGLYLPLITTNCAVLGITLLNITSNYSLLGVIIYSVSSSLGFALVIYIFSTIRQHLDNKNLDKYVKGVPIALITAGIMSLIFSRFV